MFVSTFLQDEAEVAELAPEVNETEGFQFSAAAAAPTGGFSF